MNNINMPTQEDIKNTLADLSSLSEIEYGISLQALREDPNRDMAARRLERLTGILLKRHFAHSEDISTGGQYSETNASRYWVWDPEKLTQSNSGTKSELALLNKIRGPGPWNERWDYANKLIDPDAGNQEVISWEDFISDVDTERGLFKVIALYVKDKLKGNEIQTIAKYYNAKESETLSRGLDLTTILADAAVFGPLYAAVGIPSLAVALGLFVTDIGVSRLFAEEDRHPDKRG